MFWILTILFYLYGIFFLSAELRNFLNPKISLAKKIAMRVLQKQLKEYGTQEEQSTRAKMFIKLLVFDIKYTIWLLIGLFTAQWALFVSILLLSWVTAKIIKSAFPDVVKMVSIIRIDALISFLIILTILIKHFF